VVVTSNSERRLPEPFLRRCVFHHIELTEELVRRAVAARFPSDFPNLPEAVREAAIGRFLELRERELGKKPATAELLVWLTVLAARGTVDDLHALPLAKLPALSTLVKDRDDLALLG
jgi:MoxR-like ATPase